jgi:hypothetical protein
MMLSAGYREKMVKRIESYQQYLVELRARAEVWRKAYYCHRCDWVFVPDAPNSHPGYPSGHLTRLLYEGSRDWVDPYDHRLADSG